MHTRIRLRMGRFWVEGEEMLFFPHLWVLGHNPPKSQLFYFPQLIYIMSKGQSPLQVSLRICAVAQEYCVYAL